MWQRIGSINQPPPDLIRAPPPPKVKSFRGGINLIFGVAVRVRVSESPAFGAGVQKGAVDNRCVLAFASVNDMCPWDVSAPTQIPALITPYQYITTAILAQMHSLQIQTRINRTRPTRTGPKIKH